ncbi:MAG: HD domain-containing protein [Nitrospirae bacterium]|nr:HD domain-containing protein [Nitrospirota bacterium]
MKQHTRYRKTSLKTKVSFSVALAIILTSAVGTYFIIADRHLGIEKGLIARGEALSHSLARATEEGLIAENLDLIKKAEYVVRAEDVTLAQVYSTIWDSIDSYPIEGLKVPPDNEAVNHFRVSVKPFYKEISGGFDFYSPILFNPGGSPEIPIGFIRLTLSSTAINEELLRDMINALASSAALTLIIIIAVNMLVNRLVIDPVTALQQSMTKFKNSGQPEPVPVRSGDEIGKLITEFNLMAETIHRNSAELKAADKKIREAMEDWRDTFDTITDMITIHDSDYNIIRSNKAAEKILGLPFLDAPGTKCFKHYHGTDAPPQGCPSCNCLKTGKSAAFEVFEPHLGRYIEIRAMPRLDGNNRVTGMIHVVRDISDKKKSEEKIRKQFNYINSLHTIDKAISSNLDLSITLNVLLEQVLTQLRVDAASVLLLNADSQHLEYAAAKGFRTEIIKSSSLRLGQGFAGRAAIERMPFVIEDFANPPEGVAATSLIRAEGFRVYLAVPLVARGSVKGVLEIYHRSAMELDGEWMDFLNTLAGQAAVAIDNAGMVVDLHRTYEKLVMAYDSTIEGWSRALDYRDKETEGHSERVTELTLEIAREMGIRDEELVHIRRGALLHDIGKLGVPDSILMKADKLTDEEWKIMKRHPVIAYEIISPISFLRPAISIPFYHHEKWDGTGYPTGLKGKQIPIPARIFAPVDIFDALTHARPYRPAWPEDKVIEYLRSISGAHLDPEVVEVLIRMRAGTLTH